MDRGIGRHGKAAAMASGVRARSHLLVEVGGGPRPAVHVAEAELERAKAEEGAGYARQHGASVIGGEVGGVREEWAGES